MNTQLNERQIKRDIFAFGGSAGGLESIIAILQLLPRGLPVTICVVLHRHPVISSHLVSVIAHASTLPVGEPAHGEPVALGRVYIAPRDFHMRIKKDRWYLDRDPKQHWSRPAIDPLFVSAAATHGNRAVGVLLSGGGSDGVEGLIAIKGNGGLSLVQKPEQARQPWMPLNALREDDVDAALSVEAIAALLPLLAAGSSVDVQQLLPAGPNSRA